MPGLVNTAGTIRADADIDRTVGVEALLERGRVVEFPGREPPPVGTIPDASALRQLSDLLLLPATMLHPQERAFAVDLIHSGLDQADSETRLELSKRLSKAANVAPSLVARLLRDRELPVAQPLLRHGTAVRDNDLIEVIRGGCPERTYQIAGRHKLTAEVATAIAATDFSPAIYAALRNASSELTPDLVSRIAVRARSDLSLCEPLLNRPEMSVACALDMFWYVGRSLRLYILGRFLADGSTVKRILAGSGNPAAATPLQAAAGNDGDRQRVEALQGSIRMALDALFEGDIDAAAADMSDLAGIGTATARRLLGDPGGEAVAIAVKAAGATSATFSDVLDRWRGGGSTAPRPPEMQGDLVDLFARLSRGHAAMAVTYWDWREAGRGPYAHSDIASPPALQSDLP